MVDLIGRDAGRLEGGFARQHTEIGGGEVFQASPEGPERGSLPRKDYDVAHLPLRTHLALTSPEIVGKKPRRLEWIRRWPRATPAALERFAISARLEACPRGS